MQAGTSPTSKKAKGQAPVFASLKAKNAYNKHFYTKEAQDRMHDFDGKYMMAEKRWVKRPCNYLMLWSYWMD